MSYIEAQVDDAVLGPIKDMYGKINNNYEGPPRMLNKDQVSDRIKYMQEELNELRDAEDIVDQYDAVLDILVFAFGTLEQMGLPFHDGYEIVMYCNVCKVAGTKPGREVHGKDLIKPPGWEGPERKLHHLIQQLRRDHFQSSVMHGVDPGIYNKIEPVDFPDPIFSEGTLRPGEKVQVSKPGEVSKWDGDKVPFQMIPIEALIALARGFEYGAKKHGLNNWRQHKGRPSASRVIGSILRHVHYHNAGEKLDAESGLPHLWLAMSQLAILISYIEWDSSYGT
jgi:hypothetical protein